MRCNRLTHPSSTDHSRVGVSELTVHRSRPPCLYGTHPQRQVWHIQDSQAHIMAGAFRLKSSKPFEVFSFCSEAEQRVHPPHSIEGSYLDRRQLSSQSTSISADARDPSGGVLPLAARDTRCGLQPGCPNPSTPNP